MRSHRVGDRRGFALLVALAALIIIGGLIVGAFFASTQEYRIGRNTVLQARATTAAEYGLDAIVAGGVWDNRWADSAAGAVISVLPGGTFEPGDGSEGSVQLVALGNDNFLVVSEGFSGKTLGAEGRKRLGGLLRLLKPQFNFRGAVTTNGTIMVAGTSEIHGNDAPPTLWEDCPPLAGDMPGIAYNPTTPPDIKCSGCVTGSPQTRADTAASNPSTYNIFGDINYDDLAALATKDKTFPGGTTFTNLGPTFKLDSLGNTYCDKKAGPNWGDPLHLYTLPKTVCQSYFPIIHVKGNLKLTGGAGQGILLVDGNLDASGGVNFFGPVNVRGALSVTGNGSGARFVGGVMAENVYLTDSKVAGNAVVSYSSCAIQKALNGSAPPVFDRTRGWIEMY
jgi:hypothetical protein